MFKECLEEIEPGTSDLCDGCPVKSKCVTELCVFWLKIKAQKESRYPQEDYIWNKITSDSLPSFGD